MYLVKIQVQEFKGPIHSIDLYLNFEIPSLKNQVRRTGFLQATQAVKVQTSQKNQFHRT